MERPCMNCRALSSVVLFLGVFAGIAASRTIVTSLPGFNGTLPFHLETGYVGVGEGDDSQLFYYFIESQGDATRDPLLLWMIGGPGCSSLSAILYEIGPVEFDVEAYRYGKLPSLVLREHSWTEVVSILFVDTPVDSGFSYSKTTENFVSSDTSTANYTYEFLRKWLVDHPKFTEHPIYIGGDSYGGHFTPMVTKLVADGNAAGLSPHISLEGYIIGNPVTDTELDANSRVPFVHRVGLIPDDIYEEAKHACGGIYVANSSNLNCTEYLETIENCIAGVNEAFILEPDCVFVSPKPKFGLKKWHHKYIQNPSPNILSLPKLWCREDGYVLSYIWANDPSVREALGVRNGTVWERCNKNISYIYNVPNIIDYHRYLSRLNLRALVYSGDHDMLIPYVGTLRWVNGYLNLTVTDNWRPWYLEGQVSGFTEKYQHDSFLLTYATVKGAGHTAPEYKPAQCLAMVDRWFSHHPL